MTSTQPVKITSNSYTKHNKEKAAALWLNCKFFKFISLSFVIFTIAACSSAPEKPQTNGTTDESKAFSEAPYINLDNTDQPSVVAYEEYKDPWESINRPIFKFNHYAYKYALTPLSRGYQFIIPQVIDDRISSFFFNLREPLFFLNHSFQGQFKYACTSVFRFVFNSTFGLLGLFDPADAWLNIPRRRTTFSDTLASYGVGYGIYIVLPLLGPSDLRSTATLTFDYVAHPLRYYDDKKTGAALRLWDNFQIKVPELSKYPDVIEDAEDPYIFTRNLYLQGVMRDAEAVNEDLPTHEHSQNDDTHKQDE